VQLVQVSKGLYRNLANYSVSWALCFKTHFILPEDGTIVPKHVGSRPLMYIYIYIHTLYR